MPLLPDPTELDALIAAEQRVAAIERLIERADKRRHHTVRWTLNVPLVDAQVERNRLYKALQQQCGE